MYRTDPTLRRRLRLLREQRREVQNEIRHVLGVMHAQRMDHMLAFMTTEASSRNEAAAELGADVRRRSRGSCPGCGHRRYIYKAQWLENEPKWTGRPRWLCGPCLQDAWYLVKPTR